MVTMLDRHTVPSQIVAGDDDQPASPGLGEDLLGMASEFVLRQHVDGLSQKAILSRPPNSQFLYWMNCAPNIEQDYSRMQVAGYLPAS
jgi:hypothetical protein